MANNDTCDSRTEGRTSTFDSDGLLRIDDLVTVRELFMLDDGWWAETEEGFHHWRSRLRQQVSMTIDAGDQISHRVVTDVVRDIADAALAIRICGDLNDSTAGWAYVFDADERTITARSSIYGPVEWDQPFIRWLDGAVVATWHADMIADRLAQAVNGDVWTSWPAWESGPREQPDALSEYVQSQRARPEWVFHPVVDAGPDMVQVGAAVKALMGDFAGEVSADFGHFAVEGSAVADGAGRDQTTYRVAGGYESLPGVGPAFVSSITFPLETQAAPDHDLANTLNDQMSRATGVVFLGAWVARSGAVSFKAPVMNCILGRCSLRPSGRDPLAVLSGAVATLTHAVGGFQHLGLPSGPLGGQAADDYAPQSLTILDSFTEPAFMALEEWSVGNQTGDDDDADPRLLWVPPTAEIVTWGIFNPIGPTLTSLFLCRDPSGQDGSMLVSLMRHPFLPQYTVHGAVADTASLMDLLPSVVAALRGSAPEFVDLTRCPPELRHEVEPLLVTAFTQAAAEAGEDLHAQARELREYLGRPWDRILSSSEGNQPEALPSDDADCDWWRTVTDLENVIAHELFLPSAWDGAVTYLDGHGSSTSPSDVMSEEENGQ